MLQMQPTTMQPTATIASTRVPVNSMMATWLARLVTPPSTPLMRKPTSILTGHQDDARTYRVNSVSSISSSVESLMNASSDIDVDPVELTPLNALPPNDPISSGTLFSASSNRSSGFEIPWLELSAPTVGFTEPEGPAVKRPNVIRQCSFCGTLSTPMWRHGPVGYDPLCNSCGVKWKRGRILQGLERGTSVKQRRKASTAKPREVKVAAKTKHRHQENNLYKCAFTISQAPAPVTRHAFIKSPDHLSNNHIDHYTTSDSLQTRSGNATSQYFSPIEHGLDSRICQPTYTANDCQPLTATPAQERRRSKLLAIVLEKTQELQNHHSISGCFVAHTAPNSVLSEGSIEAVTTPCQLFGTSLRSAFVCAALETVDSCTGLKIVADAVRWIQRKSLDTSSLFVSGNDFNCGVTVAQQVEEIDLDVGSLSFADWEYLCGILVSAGTI
ncbi:hypothetical protein BJ741DRAFT_77147 [Chytriomyces cf. hyalinus JEL632]|nr:hypothetical protein BJ741DRAFT_77147 [Chytriomyces cf. hyalinus JEL632]